MNFKTCQGFHVYSSEVFSAIQWFDYKILFSRRYRELIINRIKHSFGVHFWNNLSKKKRIMKSSTIDELAKEFCPESYKLNFE